MTSELFSLSFCFYYTTLFNGFSCNQGVMVETSENNSLSETLGENEDLEDIDNMDDIDCIDDNDLSDFWIFWISLTVH